MVSFANEDGQRSRRGRQRSEREKEEKEFANGLCQIWGGASVETRDTSKGNKDRVGEAEIVYNLRRGLVRCSSIEVHQCESGAAA